ALQTAIGLTAPGGRTITVGLPPPDTRISLSPLGFVAEGRSLIGSYLGSAVPARDIPRFLELWRSGRLPVELLVSSTIALDDINEAMDHLADGTAIRQLIVFDPIHAP
ncbi:MAG: alcohol dehydrogenase, partial [Mycobacterium sp.]